MSEEASSAAGSVNPATAEDIRSALSLVVDPELHMNIVDLGLVYEVKMENGLVTVQMTLTTPGCPTDLTSCTKWIWPVRVSRVWTM